MVFFLFNCLFFLLMFFRAGREWHDVNTVIEEGLKRYVIMVLGNLPNKIQLPFDAKIIISLVLQVFHKNPDITPAKEIPFVDGPSKWIYQSILSMITLFFIHFSILFFHC